MNLAITVPKGLKNAFESMMKADIDLIGGHKTLSIECSASGQPVITHWGCNFGFVSVNIDAAFRSKYNANSNADIKAGLEGAFPGLKATFDGTFPEHVDNWNLKVIEPPDSANS